MTAEAGAAEAERRFGPRTTTQPTDPLTGREAGAAEAERRFGPQEKP